MDSDAKTESRVTIVSALAASRRYDSALQVLMRDTAIGMSATPTALNQKAGVFRLLNSFRNALTKNETARPIAIEMAKMPLTAAARRNILPASEWFCSSSAGTIYACTVAKAAKIRHARMKIQIPRICIAFFGVSSRLILSPAFYVPHHRRARRLRASAWMRQLECASFQEAAAFFVSSRWAHEALHLVQRGPVTEH